MKEWQRGDSWFQEALGLAALVGFTLIVLYLITKP